MKLFAAGGWSVWSSMIEVWEVFGEIHQLLRRRQKARTGQAMTNCHMRFCVLMFIVYCYYPPAESLDKLIYFQRFLWRWVLEKFILLSLCTFGIPRRRSSVLEKANREHDPASLKSEPNLGTEGVRPDSHETAQNGSAAGAIGSLQDEILALGPEAVRAAQQDCIAL